jgi:protease I
MADITSKHVAILVNDYFEQVEFTKPKEALEQAGALTTVITTSDSDTLHGMHHAKIGSSFMPDLHIDDVHFDDYDMLVIPGGVINADKLRMNDTAREWVEYTIENDIPLGAICHAPWLLVSANVVDGLRLTSYYTLQDDIRNAGGDWVNKQLVVDGNVITSRDPDDLPAFCEALVETLSKSPVIH